MKFAIISAGEGSRLSQEGVAFAQTFGATERSLP